MNEPATPSLPSDDWQPLPTRARDLFAASLAIPMLVPTGVAGFVAFRLLDGTPVLGAFFGAVLGAALGFWIGHRQFQRVAWRLDADGLAIRRGRLFQQEIRVPATRVQHLDLKRGPWQRRRDLATLVVHTAGTRNSAVTLPHLDAGDAERLRDVLGQQIDHDEDA